MSKETALYLLAYTTFIVLAIGIAVFAAHNEARSYNKFCDNPVTTWDALWLDLRIDECD